MSRTTFCILISQLLLLPVTNSLAAPGRQIIVSSYFGQKNFKSVLNERAYLAAGNQYSPSPYYYFLEDNDGHFCNTILEGQEAMALDRMLKIGYITEAFKKESLAESASLHPSQVRFIELAEPDPTGEFSKEPFRRLVGKNAKGEAVLYRSRRKATLMTLAGQYFDPASGKIVLSEVAWQKDPVFKDFSLTIDRSKEKWIWDFRRASQAQPGLMDEILPFAGASMRAELLAMGGKIEDAYVYVLSLNHSHTIAYRRRFRNMDVHTSGEETLFRIPLAKFLESYPLNLVTERLNAMVAASHGKFNVWSAVDILNAHWNRMFQTYDLNLKGIHQNSSLISVVDVGRASIDLTVKDLLKHGLTHDETALVLKEIWKLAPARDRIATQYCTLDILPKSAIGNLAEGKNAYYVSNIPRELALHIEGFIPFLLQALLHQLSKTVIELSPHPAESYAGMDYLYQRKTFFALSTPDPELSALIKTFSPSESTTTQSSPRKDWAGEPRNYFVHYFSIEDLVRLQKGEHATPPFPERILERNYWERYEKLLDLDLF